MSSLPHLKDVVCSLRGALALKPCLDLCFSGMISFVQSRNWRSWGAALGLSLSVEPIWSSQYQLNWTWTTLSSCSWQRYWARRLSE